MPRKLKNLVGEKFGYLTVIARAGEMSNGKAKQSAWQCICKCGNKIIVRNSNLKNWSTQSCGCYHKEIVSKIQINLVNQRFGKLIVLEFVNTGNSGSRWLCRCDCGQNCIATSCNLKSGGKKSCGCKQGWWRSPVPGLWKDAAAYARWQRLDPIKRLRNSVSGSIRSMLKNNRSYKRKKSIRNYLPYSIEELKLHLESLWEPWMSWENYGGKTNDNRKTWHIDHIIPHCFFIYTSMEDQAFKDCWMLSNLRPLEKKANISKGKKIIE